MTLGGAAAAVIVSFGVAAWLTGVPAVDPRGPGERATDGIPRDDLERLRARAAARPDDATAWKDLGRAAMRAERYQEAVEAWSVVSRLSPADPDLAVALATLQGIAARSGRHPDAGSRTR